MIKLLDPFFRLLIRFKYPVSLPEHVAMDLGLPLSNHLSFDEFLDLVKNPTNELANLFRFMPRNEADNAFKYAIRKECFCDNSLFSYYFTEGWIEFVLNFDNQSRLRRLYIRHKTISTNHEIPLPYLPVEFILN